ncbi:Hint domain-containing protein [Roseovarius spongiae]|nr:Hint domain-containing protein [Roseovarius spongiae]
MGSPTIGGDTSGSVLEGSGAIVTGDLDDVNPFTGNDDDTWSISSAGSYGTATINPATGAWSYDLNDNHPAVKALDPGDTLTDTFTVTMLDADGRSDTQDVTITINGAVCFAAGTLIETAQGPRAVETLRVGDRILTADRGLQALRWTGKMRLSAEELADRTLRPVRIGAGALGAGLPTLDLRVSRQHRILVRGPVARDIFGAGEVLIPAIHLTRLPGVAVAEEVGGIAYHHLLFDAHEIVFAHGVASESFLLGEQALRTLPRESLAEIAALFPKGADASREVAPARPIAANGRQIRRYLRALRQAGGAVLEEAPAVAAE